MFVEQVGFKRNENLLVLDLVGFWHGRRAVCALRASWTCNFTDIAEFFFVNGIVKMFRRSDAGHAQQKAECQNLKKFCEVRAQHGCFLEELPDHVNLARFKAR